MRVLIVLLSILPAMALANEAEQEAFEMAAELLTTTYKCQSITGDAEPFERAKTTARQIMERAGVTAMSPEELIAIVEAQEPAGTGQFTEAFCRDAIDEVERKAAGR